MTSTITKEVMSHTYPSPTVKRHSATFILMLSSQFPLRFPGTLSKKFPYHDFISICCVPLHVISCDPHNILGFTITSTIGNFINDKVSGNVMTSITHLLHAFCFKYNPRNIISNVCNFHALLQICDHVPQSWKTELNFVYGPHLHHACCILYPCHPY